MHHVVRDREAEFDERHHGGRQPNQVGSCKDYITAPNET